MLLDIYVIFYSVEVYAYGWKKNHKIVWKLKPLSWKSLVVGLHGRMRFYF